jgi:hypothetical protein
VDIACNLVSLGMDAVLDCPCHASSHMGNEPTTADLLAVSAADHGCMQDDIVQLIYFIRRLDKRTSRCRFIAAATRDLGTGTRNLAMRELRTFEHLLIGGC